MTIITFVNYFITIYLHNYGSGALFACYYIAPAHNCIYNFIRSVLDVDAASRKIPEKEERCPATRPENN